MRRLKQDGTPMRDGNLVNLWQSKEERKEKYWLVISAGWPVSWAQRARDWRISKVEQFLRLAPPSFTNA